MRHIDRIEDIDWIMHRMNLSARKLCEKADVHHTTISRYRRGVHKHLSGAVKEKILKAYSDWRDRADGHAG